VFKHQPQSPVPFHVGDFSIPTSVPVSKIFGRLKMDLARPDPVSSECSSGGNCSSAQNSNSQQQLKCGKCLGLGHWARFCKAQWRFKVCYHYGHISRWCFSRPKAKVFWAPKPASYTAAQPTPFSPLQLTYDRIPRVTIGNTRP
jgi:hypothetical protein